MSHNKNTEYRGHDLASDYHRICGKCCYLADIDHTISPESEVDNMYYEFDFKNNKPTPIALIDFKMPGEYLSDKFCAIQLQINIADKLEIPFFFIVSYLLEEHEVKCYYIIPINEIARNKWKGAKPGQFCSLKQYSQFQHKLRGKTWNKDELIDNRNLALVGLPENMKLGDLSNEIKHYKLPRMEFGFL